MAFIIHWLNSGNASWAILVAALRDRLVGLGALANKIAKKHPNPGYRITSNLKVTSRVTLTAFFFTNGVGNLFTNSC